MDAINAYKALIRLPTFSLKEAIDLAGNRPRAYALLATLIDKGLVRKIRSNLYSAVNLLTDQVIATPYQIACATRESAYLWLHTAMEFHGLCQAWSHEIHVASDSTFREFQFDGTLYKSIPSKMSIGIDTVGEDDGIRVTDVERTIIDGMQHLGLVGGLNTILQCIAQAPKLDEQKLISYLEAYNTQVLYQKAGFLLSPHQVQLGISQAFLNLCHDRIGKSKRYLEPDKPGSYVARWRLIVPQWLKRACEFQE